VVMMPTMVPAKIASRFQALGATPARKQTEQLGQTSQ
jgi:hypothetical protein